MLPACRQQLLVVPVLLAQVFLVLTDSELRQLFAHLSSCQEKQQGQCLALG
jgi:hypothetical protein